MERTLNTEAHPLSPHTLTVEEEREGEGRAVLSPLMEEREGEGRAVLSPLMEEGGRQGGAVPALCHRRGRM